MKQTPVEWFATRDTELTIQFLEGKLNQIQLAIEKTKCLEEAKAMEQEQSMAIKDTLGRIDDGLSWLEDFFHGRVGERITEMRSLVQDFLKTLTPTK